MSEQAKQQKQVIIDEIKEKLDGAQSVTNNIDEALFLGDRIVLMEGKLPGTVKTEYCVDLPRPREHTSIALLQLRKLITDNTELVL